MIRKVVVDVHSTLLRNNCMSLLTCHICKKFADSSVSLAWHVCVRLVSTGYKYDEI